MKKSTLIALVLALGLTPGLTGSAVAQKKHAPKPIWGAMVANLSDIQSITAALAVFDMKRAATIADGLVQRETFLSKMEQLADVVKKGYGKVADAAKEFAAATKSGDEQAVLRAREVMPRLTFRSLARNPLFVREGDVARMLDGLRRGGLPE